MAATDEKTGTPEREGEAEQTAAPGNGGNGTHAGSEETHAAAGASGAGEPDEVQAELDKVRAQLAERQDSHLRLQAEFENFKKRMIKEQSEQLKYAQMPLLKDLTQAMDNLERALAHIRTQGSAEAKGLAGGIEMVAKQMGDTFERYGLTRVKTQGAPFDPTRHEAVSVVETDQVPENHVLQEFQAGYVLHDRVVRPAMVSVSKKAGGAGGNDGAAPKGETKG